MPRAIIDPILGMGASRVGIGCAKRGRSMANHCLGVAAFSSSKAGHAGESAGIAMHYVGDELFLRINIHRLTDVDFHLCKLLAPPAFDICAAAGAPIS